MYHCVLFKSLTLTSWRWIVALGLWKLCYLTKQMNVPSGHQEKKKLYYPFGIFYQCYALARCTSQMYRTELPSLGFTKQSYWRLVQWNVIESLWGGGGVQRG